MKKNPVASARLKAFYKEWVEPLIVAAFLAFCVIRPFIVEAYKIPTGSMRQTLLEGDMILVNKFIYGARIPFTDVRLPRIRDVKRGDVIVFIFPQDPRKNFVKRVVAMEGETVEIREGTIYVNEKPLVDPLFSVRYYYNRGDFGKEGKKVTVPKDTLFVLGDNSASSHDSRYWGFMPRRNIQGEAILIFWPPHRIRIIR